MSYQKDVKMQKQIIARAEQQLAIEKIKQRRADTRNKIQLGGLVIKSEMNTYSKEIVLGALIHAFNMIQKDEDYKTVFSSIGENSFMGTSKNGK